MDSNPKKKSKNLYLKFHGYNLWVLSRQYSWSCELLPTHLLQQSNTHFLLFLRCRAGHVNRAAIFQCGLAMHTSAFDRKDTSLRNTVSIGNCDFHLCFVFLFKESNQESMIKSSCKMISENYYRKREKL